MDRYRITFKFVNSPSAEIIVSRDAEGIKKIQRDYEGRLGSPYPNYSIDNGHRTLSINTNWSVAMVVERI